VQRANVALFLLAIGLIGLAPLVLGLVALARRRADRRDAAEHRTLGRRALLGILAGSVALASVAAAWAVSGRGVVPADETTGMAGMASMDATAMQLEVPSGFAGELLTTSIGGDEAIAEVAALHGARFPVTQAAIATYGDGRIKIWLSAAPDEATAAEQVEEMARRIAAGGSPFSAPVPLAGERRIYRTSGMGQRHFFFSSGSTVWWVAADPDLAERVLAEVVDEAR
jgi:hypothetical protein